MLRDQQKQPFLPYKQQKVSQNQQVLNAMALNQNLKQHLPQKAMKPLDQYLQTQMPAKDDIGSITGRPRTGREHELNEGLMITPELNQMGLASHLAEMEGPIYQKFNEEMQQSPQRPFVSNYPQHLNDFSENLKKRQYSQMGKQLDVAVGQPDLKYSQHLEGQQDQLEVFVGEPGAAPNPLVKKRERKYLGKIVDP
jgi:hypothetical protein